MPISPRISSRLSSNCVRRSALSDCRSAIPAARSAHPPAITEMAIAPPPNNAPTEASVLSSCWNLIASQRLTPSRPQSRRGGCATRGEHVSDRRASRSHRRSRRERQQRLGYRVRRLPRRNKRYGRGRCPPVRLAHSLAGNRRVGVPVDRAHNLAAVLMPELERDHVRRQPEHVECVPAEECRVDRYSAAPGSTPPTSSPVAAHATADESSYWREQSSGRPTTRMRDAHGSAQSTRRDDARVLTALQVGGKMDACTDSA